ncbi:hypothetical protein EZV62_012244 [Acer yangbiense]|uniref:DUF4283 domain-containing protein n=1 Tax=Acer yangbiense TaxID=1000413 RepID=A0A5C7HUV2_9ROSI|nr:hypothetical protein EZV62_012244 [Acer yangbiense]
MDHDEIARLYASLFIKSKEEKLWSVRDMLKVSAGKKLELCLVGKILSNKRINKETFRVVMLGIWQTSLDIEVVQDNTFLFYFRNQGDMYRILARGPWCIDNCLLVLEKISGVGDINNLAFNKWTSGFRFPMRLFYCHNRKDGDIRGVDVEFEYGSWMRATNPLSQNMGAIQFRSQGDVPNTKVQGLRRSPILNMDNICSVDVRRSMEASDRGVN